MRLITSYPHLLENYVYVYEPELGQLQYFKPDEFNEKNVTSKQKIIINKILYLEKFSSLSSFGHQLIILKPETPLEWIEERKKLRIEKSFILKKVFIVDDSKTIQILLQKIINSDPRLISIAVAEKPSQVQSILQTTHPDIVTLDLHLPEMDGVQTFKKFIYDKKIPTLIISSLNINESNLVLDALEAGAVDYIQKPAASELATSSEIIKEKIFQASQAIIQEVIKTNPARNETYAQKTAPEPHSLDSPLIVIGSSTGGTEALKSIFINLPKSIPPILVVQHIPAVFSKAFADRMNQLCPFHVLEAHQDQIVEKNCIYIAPGGYQMRVVKSGGQLMLKIEDTAPVNRHKPSVDVLFRSTKELNLKKCAAAILTGMGSDGARGLLELKQQGHPTIAQNESSCVVYGMPREAVKLNAADHILELTKIGSMLMKLTS